MITLCISFMGKVLITVLALFTLAEVDAQVQSIPGAIGTQYKQFSIIGDVDSTTTISKKLATRFMQITNGATTGYVIQGDGSGNASWVNSNTLSLASSQINAALGYTPYNATNPNGYISTYDTASLSNRINGKLSIVDTLSLSNRINGKFATPTGSTAQYLLGNGTLATFPTVVSSFSNDAGYLTSGTQTQLAAGSGIIITGSGTKTIAADTTMMTVARATDSIASINTKVNQKVTLAEARAGISLTTTGTSGVAAYNSTTGVLNVPNYTYTASTPLDSNKTRTLGSSFRVNLTRNASVVYSVFAQVTSALAGTNTATVTLETSPNNSTWTTKSVASVSVSGVLSTNGGTTPLYCYVPAGYYVRISTAATGANSASAVFTYISGQEKHE